MEKEIYQIYDKIFKKILTLSSTAVVNLINGLYDTNYPPDSTIDYNWTEFHDNELRRTLADTIITINHRYSYHIEAQLLKDENLIFRVFEYGFNHASRNYISNSYEDILPFPESRIIYLYSTDNIPDKYTLTLDFGTQGRFQFQVPVIKYLNTTPEELTKKKMVILIPFELLKLRKIVEKNRSPENLEALKTLIKNDIIGSINENLALGNITLSDAQKLKRLTHKLYEHIYAHYEEMEVLNEMTDESLMLDIDILEKKHEEELAEAVKAAVAKKDKEIADVVAEKDNKIMEKDNKITEKDNEIAALKRQLAEALTRQ